MPESPLAAPFSVHRGDVELTTDQTRMDADVIHGFLAQSYWAADIPRDVMLRAMRNSLCFALLRRVETIGFARVVTDAATFAYLADVFIVPAERGAGMGTWLVATLTTHPALAGLRRFLLVTRDAHALYSLHGFKPLARPERFMECWNPDVYTDPKG
jgi:GNAT superfamily N-acetyltransferase